MGSCLSLDGAGGGSNNNSSSTPPPPAASRKVRRGGSGRRRPGWESEQQEMLRKIPGRMYLNGASSVASLFTLQGKKGTNQDAMIVWENFCSRTDTVFCGVFDGHGPFGHMVARKVRDTLPLKLSSQWEVNIGNNEEAISVCLDGESRDLLDGDEETPPEFLTKLKDSFLKAFKVMDKELKFHSSIDCLCSGTTAVTLVKQGPYLVIGNIGDSRAVLGTRDLDDSLVAVQLTVDLKPNLPKEEERIKRCRGRVFALRDEPEVARVWLPNNDAPGLAMARAFGDFCLKDFGLISVPEISCRRLTERDEFIVLATDGVWDVLSNNEVVNIVASAPSRSSAARSLVESAVRAWRYRYPTSKVDDCAVVCLFLDNDLGITASASDITNIESLEIIKDGNKMQELPEQQVEGKGKEKGSEVRNRQLNAGPGSHQRTPSDGNSISVADGEEWSALEGVSRVNTLLTLPRFSVAEVSKSKKLV